MSGGIIGLHKWFLTPAGQYLLRWQEAQLQSSVADIFGYHALQLGVPQLNALQANRMPHQWLAVDTFERGGISDPGLNAKFDLVADYAALPFPACSLDLVVLPHTLELSADPHATLREVERVLVPEGKVVICGFNPTSLWGVRQRRARALQRLGVGDAFLPDCAEFIGYWRLRDWLRLLSFEVEVGRFGCYRPAVGSEKWLERWAWMDALGARWWPILGSGYFVVAVKRVRGMRLLGPAWKAGPARKVGSVPVVQRQQPSWPAQE